MAVELGRTWCVRHGHLRFTRVVLGRSGGAAMLNRDARARRQVPPRATLPRSLGLSEGTAPAGGWIRRRRRRATERRRAGRDGLNVP